MLNNMHRLVSPSEIAGLLDHTLLKPDATRNHVESFCREAVEFGFACAIVNPAHTPLCARILSGSRTRVGVPVSFPLGSASASWKEFEAARSIEEGATEVDMVINIGAVKDDAYDVVEDEISAVARVCHKAGYLCKAVLETGYLTDEEIVKACQVAEGAGIDFVKTSTGLGPRGATVEDVALMRRTVGAGVGVKAAGGIRTLKDVLTMVEAGANRIGTSASVTIVRQAADQENS